MTGADRAWAARYDAGDVLHYIRGSKDVGIEAGSYAQVVATASRKQSRHGAENPMVNSLHTIHRAYAVSPHTVRSNANLPLENECSSQPPTVNFQIANRDMGTLKSFDPNGGITVRMDSGKEVSFDPRQMRHFDHGYAITSHSSQGLTSRTRIGEHGHEKCILSSSTEDLRTSPSLVLRRMRKSLQTTRIR